MVCYVMKLVGKGSFRTDVTRRWCNAEDIVKGLYKFPFIDRFICTENIFSNLPVVCKKLLLLNIYIYLNIDKTLKYIYKES